MFKKWTQLFWKMSTSLIAFLNCALNDQPAPCRCVPVNRRILPVLSQHYTISQTPWQRLLRVQRVCFHFHKHRGTHKGRPQPARTQALCSTELGRLTAPQPGRAGFWSQVSEAQNLTSSYVQRPVLFAKLNDSFHKLLAAFLFQSAPWTENCYFTPLMPGFHSRQDSSLIFHDMILEFSAQTFFGDCKVRSKPFGTSELASH